jgi:hypothetical protein
LQNLIKFCCKGQITQRRMPDLWQKDSNVIRYEDQEVRRSNTELTDEGPQGGSYPLNADLVSCWGGEGGGGRGRGGSPVLVLAIEYSFNEGSW